MPGEGERREGEDGSEDHFEKYAEELGRKYEEARASGESPEAARPVSAPDHAEEIHGETAESNKDSENPGFSVKQKDEISGETVENRDDEFEAYAKELKGRYDDKGEGTGSTRTQETNRENDGKAAFQEEGVSHGQNEQAENESKESAEPDLQRRVDASEEKPTDMGRYQRIADDRKESLDTQTPTSNLGRPMGTPLDTPSSEIREFNPSTTDFSKVASVERGGSEGNRRLMREESQTDRSPRAEQQGDSQPNKRNPDNGHPNLLDQMAYSLGNTKGSAEGAASKSGGDVRRKEPESNNSRKDGVECPERQIESAKGDARQGNSENLRADDNRSEKKRQGSLPEKELLRPAELDRVTKAVKYENGRYNAKVALDEVPKTTESSKEIRVVVAGEWGRRNPAYVLVPKEDFQNLTGTRLERGKTYDVHFEVNGLGSWTRHREDGNQLDVSSIRLYINKTYSDRLKIGESCSVTFDYVTDKRCLKVTKNYQGPVLRFYRQYLQSTGFKESKSGESTNPVVEIGARNFSRGDNRIRTLYTTFRIHGHKPGYEVAMLPVRRLGIRQGEIIEVHFVKRFSQQDFVEGFNRSRRGNLRNVSLNLKSEKLLMAVDGKEFLLTNPHLSTHRLQVCLRAELEQTKKQIFFWFDGEDTETRFLQKKFVKEMHISDSALEIRYKIRGEHTFRYRFSPFSTESLKDQFKLLSRPTSDEDPYRFAISKELKNRITSRLAKVQNSHQMMFEKGDISEAILRHLLTSTGLWKEVAYHPQYKGWREYESRKTGPDSIQRSNATGDLAYFEFNWSNSPYVGYYKGRSEGFRDLRKWPEYEGEKIKTAYIGILQWNLHRDDMNFYLKEAYPKEDPRGKPVTFGY